MLSRRPWQSLAGHQGAAEFSLGTAGIDDFRKHRKYKKDLSWRFFFMRACFKLGKYCTLVLSQPTNVLREQIIGSTFWSKFPSILQTMLGL